MNPFLVAVLALMVAEPASAQDASIAQASGPVFIVPAGGVKSFAAKGGESLIFEDTVRVGKGGIAHINLQDRGSVLLREETVLTLKGTASRCLLAFKFGEFLIGLRKKLEAGQSFKVRTPAAVAAVRGTLFWGKSDRADKQTTYAGFGHTVAVTAKGKTVLVKPGKTVTVAFGEAPAEPVDSTVTLDYAKNFAINGELQGVDELADDEPE